MNLPCLGGALLFQINGERAQHLAINLDSGLFHPDEHRHQRQINLLIERHLAGGFHFFAQDGSHASGQVSGFCNRTGKAQS